MLASWADHKSKNCHFEMSYSLTLCNNNKPFLNLIVMCNKKWILYDHQRWPSQGLDQEETPKCASHSVLSDSLSPWTVDSQAPLSVEFSRQEYWSGWPFPSPGDLHNPGIKPKSCALQTDSSPSEPSGTPLNKMMSWEIQIGSLRREAGRNFIQHSTNWHI